MHFCFALTDNNYCLNKPLAGQANNCDICTLLSNHLIYI